MRGEFRRPCIKAATKRDIVLPFAGSGTVAVVARKTGRRAVLIEMSEAYCALSVDRLRQGVLV